jgi:hypothetical protein
VLHDLVGAVDLLDALASVSASSKVRSIAAPSRSASRCLHQGQDLGLDVPRAQAVLEHLAQVLERLGGLGAAGQAVEPALDLGQRVVERRQDLADRVGDGLVLGLDRAAETPSGTRARILARSWTLIFCSPAGNTSVALEVALALQGVLRARVADRGDRGAAAGHQADLAGVQQTGDAGLDHVARSSRTAARRSALIAPRPRGPAGAR